jgi:hypothetical protein
MVASGPIWLVFLTMAVGPVAFDHLLHVRRAHRDADQSGDISAMSVVVGVNLLLEALRVNNIPVTNDGSVVADDAASARRLGCGR